MRTLRYGLAACALLIAVSGQARADECDCPGTPGYVLDLPDTVALGTSFDVCFEAPGGSLVFIVVSSSSGPLNTKFGTLCVGIPFITLWPLDMPAEGALCLRHDAGCDEALVGFTGYFQFVALGPNPGQYGISNSQCLTAVAGGACTPQYATYTQGGWGAKCNGNNVACLRDAEFDNVFPGELILGDPDGDDADGIFALVLTDSQAVENFLPDGTTPEALAGDEVDPVNSSAGVLAGQLTAAKLNVGFDDADLFDSLKDPAAGDLGDLIFVAGVADALIGESVRDVIALADKAISGEEQEPFDVDGDLVGDVSFSDISTALDVENSNFDNGNQNNGNLAEP